MATLVGRRQAAATRNGLRSSTALGGSSSSIGLTPVSITTAASPDPRIMSRPATAPAPPPMAHMGFEGSRHLEPERLPSGRKERARTVRVIELNQVTIDSITLIADGIRRLDLSSLKLEELNEGLMEAMVGLERLDIGFNQLTDEAIPACFNKMENLVELAAHYNKLTMVPKVLRKLKNMSRLKIGHNQIKTMDGIERLKKLQVLVIENNEIETVPREFYQNVKRLEMWHFSNNLLKELHSDVRLLRYLRDLDISGNALMSLPPELFLLPRLEVLNASSNQISRIPTVNVKGNSRQHLSHIDLSDNQLIKFPEHLLLLAHKVDLSKNKIKVIPSNLIKKLDWGTEQQLMVADNPLTNPPLDICECGLRSIMQFFQDAKTDAKIYQGLKVLVLGAPGSGKTSLVQTLVDQQSRLTSAEEVTAGIDMYELSIDVEPEPVQAVTEPAPAPEETPPTAPSPTKTTAKSAGRDESTGQMKKLTKRRSKSQAASKRKDRASVDSVEGSRNNSRATRKRSPEKKVPMEDPPPPTPTTPGAEGVTEGEEEKPKEPEVPETRVLNLSVWDFSGNPHYLYSHYIFLQQPSLVWLVFDLSTYDDERFTETLGCWMDWFIAKTNHFVALLVGTHADKLKPPRVQEICDSVANKSRDYLLAHKEAIEKEIKKIESKPQISPALSEQLKRYITLLKLEPKIFPQVLAVSSKDAGNVDALLEATKTMALDKEVYPEVLKVIPSLWANVEYYIEDKGYGMQVPLMTYDEYSDEISKKFGMKHLIDQITRYMHDTGKVLWFSDHPTLTDYVFLRPSWLADLFKSLFRHDWSEADYNLEEAFKASAMNPHKVEKLKKELTEDGVADKDILKCLWSHLIPTELNKPILEVISILLDHFEIGYPLGKPGARESTTARGVGGLHSDRSDSTSTLRSSTRTVAADKHQHDNRADSSVARSDRTESQATTVVGKKPEKPDPPKVTRMLIPWLRTNKQPIQFMEEYDQYKQKPCLVAVFRFPRYTPPGLFETLIVRALRPSHDLSTLQHWTDGLYARNVAQALRLYVHRIRHDEDGSTCMRIEVRSEYNQVPVTSSGSDSEDEASQRQNEADKMAEMLWGLMLPYLRDAEELIGKFAGARVERYMECPECSAMSFLGEWLTPKELQNSTSKPCDACQATIPTALLVQPKEKKKVEEFLLQKLQKASAARAEKLAAAAAGDAAAGAAGAGAGDSGVDTGSDVITNGESHDQTRDHTEAAANGPREKTGEVSRKSSADVKRDAQHANVRRSSGKTRGRERKTSEMSMRSTDDVTEEPTTAGEVGTEGDQKKVQKKRKRSTVSHPDSSQQNPAS